MDPNTDTRNAPVPPEFSDGAKEVPIIDNQNSNQETQPQPQPQVQAQPQQAAQPQVQGAVPNPQVQTNTVDIEALKRQAQARRQGVGGKKQEEYREIFTKRYFLAVSILLIVAAFVFGTIIIIQLTRG